MMLDCKDEKCIYEILASSNNFVSFVMPLFMAETPETNGEPYAVI